MTTLTRRSTLSLVLLLGLVTRARASDYEVIINEIHYNPFGPSANGDLEFIELHNLGTETVDLGGWVFAEGIRYACPKGLTLGPKEYLVFSPDPERAKSTFGLSRAMGPYDGSLDNNGEIVALFNAMGRMVSRVNYRDDGEWPSLADGFGPSIEFTGEDNGNDVHSRWAASLVMGGTPGRRNSTYAPPAALPDTGRSSLLPSTANFRTFKGTGAPSSPALGWTAPEFNDAAWTALPGPFGFGNIQGYTITTQLGDMQGRYSTFYVRGTFDLTDEDLAAVLSGEKKLSVQAMYDDAFVAYLNGVEVGRDNVGTAGTAVAYNANANSGRTAELEISLAAFQDALKVGANVLAVQGVNVRANPWQQQDFLLGASVWVEGTAPPPPPETEGSLVRGVINEYGPGAAGAGFIELYNPRSVPLDLGGSFLRLGTGESYQFPVPVVLDPGAYHVVGTSVLGFTLPATEESCVILAPDDSTLVDALKVDPAGTGTSCGRFPDGDEDTFVMTTPTSGAPNVYTFRSPVVIHEIHFHPPYVPPGGSCTERCSDLQQWIELWNSGPEEADLTGWSISKGIDFEFAPGTKIPAGQALVVASSVATFKELHPGVENVVGDWSGRLSHASDTINLRDALGNRVDHVKYGDGAPTNDEAPANGIDDRTFRGSPWPAGADGSGSTLELVSPALENKFGLSWRASATPGGTPGAPNSLASPEPGPVVDGILHAPLVPRSTDAVTVTCRLSAPGGIQNASVQWATGGGTPSSAPLNDDGTAPDGTAGDGIFSASIPPQNDGSIVLFQVRVDDLRGASIVVPVPPAVSPYAGFTGPFFLYEVDDFDPPASGSPSYRIVMAPRDLQELRSRDVNSDVLLPCTFIGSGEVRHVAGIRFRGETSRREPNRSYRIDFPSESLFDGVEHLNLNGSNGGRLGASIVNEILACDLFRRASAPYPQMYPVNLHFAGEVARDWDSRYARKENIDDAFLSRYFGGSDDGNLYRARNPDGPGSPSGDFSYLGTDPDAYRELYDKKTNREEDDFSDIIALARAFNPAQTPNDVFADTIEDLIDPVQWARFFALQSIISNIDGGIWNNNGEDFFLYHVPADSRRADADKFLLLPWDLEETFADAEEALFQPDVPSIRRFLTHPRFAALYYAELAAIRDSVLSRFEMRRSYGFVARMFPAADVFNVVDPLDTYMTDRIGYLDVNVSPNLTAGPVSAVVAGTTIVAPGDVWKFFRGTSPPPGEASAWTTPSYDDSSWESGPTGIGYGDGDDATELTDMLDNYTTIFTRKTFQIADPATVAALTLLVDYDDAFVAYVNGHEVARSPSAAGNPGEPVSFDDEADQTHEAGDPESFELSTTAAQLVAGDNILAVVVLNERASSSDFSFIPSLVVRTAGQQGSVAGGCGGPIYVTGNEVILSGTADPVTTKAVRVNGVAATLSYVTQGDGPFGVMWSARVTLLPGDEVLRITAYPDEGAIAPPVQSTNIPIRRFSGSFATLGGTLAGDTTWTAAGGPYRIVQTVQVPAGVTLQIEPGAVILANAGTGIIVRGRILATGEEDSPILFNAFTCDGWGGILMQDTGTDDGAPVQTLRHCVIERGEALAGAQGVIAPVNAKLLLEGSTLRLLGANAVDGNSANVVIRGCRFEDIFEGVHCTSSFVVIEDCVFRHMIGDNDAIDFDATVGGRCRIARCTIDDSTDDGIDLATATVDIEDNVLSRIADKGMSFEGNGPSGGPTIARNLIHGCGTGVALKNGVTVEGDHDTITECQEGINLFAKDAGPEGGHGTFHSMIVWNNIADVLLDAKSTVAFTLSDVGSGEPWPGEGNTACSPLFAAPWVEDYSLLPGSPCIGTGRDGTDMGAVPFSGTPAVTFLRFDANGSGLVDISDAITALRSLFLGDEAPTCLDRLDANDDGNVDIADPIYALQFLFQGGPTILPPYPEVGPDPTPDELSCEP